MAIIVKQGPCGGLGGSPGGMGEDAKILKIRITDRFPYLYPGTIIGMQVFYEDRNGDQKWSPVWGNKGADLKHFREIELQEGEDLKSISGHTGRTFDNNVIRSLTIVSNKQTYGPYGVEDGLAFNLSAGNTGKIGAFHVQSGDLLDSIGIYVKQEMAIVKQGPCGGLGGSLYDMGYNNVKILKIKISHVLAIIGIQLFYEDSNGGHKWTPVWGNKGAALTSFTEIELQPGEDLKTISGHIGRAYDNNVITSLTIVSTKQTYGPYGVQQGRAFNLSAGDAGKIVGLYGYSGDLLDSIGIYAKQV